MTDSVVDVYEEARLDNEARYGKARRAKRFWQATTVLSMLATVGLTAMFMIGGAAIEVRPYVVAIDPTTKQVTGGFASKDNAKISEKAIKYALTHWIEKARSVYFDSNVQAAAWQDVRAVLGPTAEIFIKDYGQDPVNNPYARRQHSVVDVSVDDYQVLEKNTVRIVWTEHERTLSGDLSMSKKWQANLTYSTNPPTNSAEAIRNPIGLRIETVTWAELQ